MHGVMRNCKCWELEQNSKVRGELNRSGNINEGHRQITFWIGGLTKDPDPKRLLYIFSTDVA